MESWPLTTRVTSAILLWFLSVAPGVSASVDETASRRQTEFSDRNYQPSLQINTTAPVRSPARHREPPRERQIIQSRTEKISWIDARGTEQKYEMYYEHDGSRVTFASVCSNHRSGSIDYRNCRKAAKRWFASRCNASRSAGRMYCQAANAFHP